MTDLSPDFIYYDILVADPPVYNDGLTKPIYANYDNTQDNPILPKSGDYYMSVVRFEIPGGVIPIMEMPIKPGITQSNINLTPFSVTLVYNNASDPDYYQQYLIYTPNVLSIDTSRVVPPSENGGIQPVPYDPYYFVYDYQTLIDMTNTALAKAFTDLNTAHPGAVSSAPYFIYDSSTQLLSLIAPYGYSSTTVTIYMNSPLAAYYSGFPVYDYGYNNANGLDVQYRVYNTGANAYAPPGSTIPAPPTNPAYFSMEQQWVGIGDWDSVTSIVFISKSMPIAPEYYPQYFTTYSNQDLTGLNAFRKIVTDFQPSLQGSNSTRTTMQYYPQGPYRLIDMVGQDPLRRIDIQLFWADNFNQLYPIELYTGSSFSAKILFIKKSLVKAKGLDYVQKMIQQGI